MIRGLAFGILPVWGVPTACLGKGVCLLDLILVSFNECVLK